jgi:hypothetical protein
VNLAGTHVAPPDRRDRVHRFAFAVPHPPSVRAQAKTELTCQLVWPERAALVRTGSAFICHGGIELAVLLGQLWTRA